MRLADFDRTYSECPVSTTRTDLRWYEPGHVWVRRGADIGEIHTQRGEYRRFLKNLRYSHDALLLDLGAYIGETAVYFREELGLTRSVSVEPLLDNFSVAEINLAPYNQAKLLHGGVVGDDREQVILFIGREYLSSSSLEYFKGRQSVVAPAIKDVDLFAFNPAIIKCDIEGSEFGIRWNLVPDSVTEIIMELHQNRPQWIEQGRALDETLLSLGFKHIRKPKHEPLFLKRQIAVWSRRV